MVDATSSLFGDSITDRRCRLSSDSAGRKHERRGSPILLSLSQRKEGGGGRHCHGDLDFVAFMVWVIGEGM
jgi:hypothetical protein